MMDPNFIIMYVDNPPQSARFYEGILGKSPIEDTPTFAMFALKSGVMLGLWSKHTVEPAVEPKTEKVVSDGELAFSLADREQVNKTYADWVSRGLVVVQEPTDMDFGYTFVALDPDGHRLRVFAIPA